MRTLTLLGYFLLAGQVGCRFQQLVRLDAVQGSTGVDRAGGGERSSLSNSTSVDKAGEESAALPPLQLCLCRPGRGGERWLTCNLRLARQQAGAVQHIRADAHVNLVHHGNRK